MWGDLIDVTGLDAERLRAERQRLRLSQRETASRMFRTLTWSGRGARDGIALGDKGFTWATEAACLRAVSELENRVRVMKEEQYVNALLAVLGLTPADVGLAVPARPLPPETMAAVMSLPNGVRGILVNMHGELLVYAEDDVLYHSDADWKPCQVRNGQTRELILDVHERSFVRTLWEQGEEVRRHGGAAAAG